MFLVIVVYYGQEEVVVLLLCEGVWVDVKDSYGNSFLINVVCVVYSGKDKVVDFLVISLEQLVN